MRVGRAVSPAATHVQVCFACKMSKATLSALELTTLKEVKQQHSREGSAGVGDHEEQVGTWAAHLIVISGI